MYELFIKTSQTIHVVRFVCIQFHPNPIFFLRITFKSKEVPIQILLSFLIIWLCPSIFLMTCDVSWSDLVYSAWRPASVLFQRRWKTHTLDLPLSNYLIQHGNFKKSTRLNFHIYIDLNYFGPRGLNKLQSGRRGVALFFSSFTGIWFNWYRGALQKREMGKTASGT